jgi:uracil-DNA glycosylase family 4
VSRLPHPVTGKPYPSPVPPGTGWPGDPADASTPVASSPQDVRRLAAKADLPTLEAEVSVCRACPRLVEWREGVAVEKRASFADQPYWGRPIAGWGSDTPALVIVGLAPAAHGGNRTGRIFTGDRSGDWLFASLHRVGLATQATSLHAGDGQALVGARMVATVRCAPPLNKPTTEERDTCAPWIEAEIARLAPHVRVVLALGSYGWDAALRTFRGAGYAVPRPKPRFTHGATATLTPPTARAAAAGSAGPAGAAGAAQRASAAGDGAPREVTLLGCFHPSQQNTFTGRLTEAMLDDVLGRAAALASR